MKGGSLSKGNRPPPPRTPTHARAEADPRWLDAPAAAAWVASKLSAAERLWRLAASPQAGARRVDFALVMEGAEDEAFFMTDFAQE